MTNNLELFEVVLKRDPGGGGDGVVRDQPAHRVHGLPPPARPLAHQAEANRLQAARGGGGSSYSADQSLLRNIHLEDDTDVSQNTAGFHTSPPPHFTENYFNNNCST